MRRTRSIKAVIASCALALLAFALPSTAPAAEYGIDEFSGGLFGAGLSSYNQAGGRPESAVATIKWTLDPGQAPFEVPVEDTKNVVVELPPGLVGNPLATERCSGAQFHELGKCPPGSQIGTVQITGGILGVQEFPVYNLVPPKGVPALFAFQYVGVTVSIRASIRSDSDYGINLISRDVSQEVPVVKAVTRIWGVPADQTFAGSRKPLISNATSCTAAGVGVRTNLWVNSWVNPDRWVSAFFDADSNGNPTEVRGCAELGFAPTIQARPTTTLADSPTGLEFDLHIPQNEDPDGRSTAHLKDVAIELPEGLTVNPSSANGLEACTPAQIGMTTPVGAADASFTAEPDNCPGASTLGSVRVHSPAVDHPLPGAVFLASQNQNPFNSLLAIYLAVDDPQSGVVAKLPGEVRADPVTGRLTATFKDNPQLPVEDIEVDFFGGPTASLRTPPTCGTFTTTSILTPWSTPEGANATPSSSFEVTKGAGGGNCVGGASQAPHRPAFAAGTADPSAGIFTPFGFRLARADGTQEIKAIDTTLPKGLLAKLAGTTYCPDATLGSIGSRTGEAEQSSPSCPATSHVGIVDVGAGAGSQPLYVRGQAYLAGPYKAAPLSLAIVTPAVAGPFDLGNVVVRTALEVNPETAQVHAVSDSIPTILQGIPLDVRSIDLTLDRPGFTLNPTSCAKTSVIGSALSIFGQSASLTSPFQVGDCARLGFKPKLALSLKGGTKRSDFPALTATLTARPGDASIARTTVALPRSEFLAQSHIRTICTRVQFAADQCPPRSIYGSARAISPLLDGALEGPVYLRSSSNPLPDLVVALRGQIDVDLVGRIDSFKGGIRTSFESVPDAPVSKFVLRMQGGKKGLLENSRNLCGSTNRATVKMEAQNGKAHDFRPVLKSGCGRKNSKPRPRGNS